MITRPFVPSIAEPLVPVGRWLERQVELLEDAFRAHDPLALYFLRGSGAVQGADEDLWAAGLTQKVAREAIARDHSYQGWSDVERHVDDLVHTGFEAAADAIQWGDVETLQSLLDGDPQLVHRHSPFPHGAMLLHYVAANGVEVERQIQSPPNAVDILRLLLERGAEPDATCTSYGTGQTTLCLLVSSAHPAHAGVQAALVEHLCRGGVDPNGPAGDGLPLWTAITIGYTKAAEALARCGAYAGNLVFAAALGDLEAVQITADHEARSHRPRAMLRRHRSRLRSLYGQ